MAKTKINSLSELLLKDLQEIRDKLNLFLIESDQNTQGLHLLELVDLLKKVKVKKKDIDYAAFILDNNGYIIQSVPFADFAPLEGLPKDVAKGYYKLENGEVVIDYQRQRQIEEV